MSKKVTMAHRISVENCECCGGVHIQLWRNGQMFAVAIPSDAGIAEQLSTDLQGAVKVMRAAEGKSRVH